jgi:23S rRNA pseudouridine1911/1915/1917 synthase
MKKRVFTRAPQDPEPLDELLAARLAISDGDARAILRRGGVHVDGRRAVMTMPIAVGAKVVVFVDDRPAHDAELTIAFRDDDVLIVDKPAGIASQAERANSEDALDARVQRLVGGDARLLHRLDKETSGLVLFALRAEVLPALQQSLESGDIDRRYVAVVSGRLDGDGSIRLRIGRHAIDQRVRAAFAEQATEGRAACSHYRALAHHEDTTAVELTLETGRTHQLRVHLAAIGHPIVGDAAYGGRAFARLCLHAEALSLPHPVTRRPIVARAGLPPEFAQLVPGLTTPRR